MNIEPGQGENDCDLQQDKEDHQKVVDALEYFEAIFRSFRIHLKELDELHHEIAARHEAEHQSTQSD
jgi:hypothetical protein